LHVLVLPLFLLACHAAVRSISVLTAGITRNERYHQFYAIFFLVQTILISFILFQRLV
jgi:hypothetical protein